eukprot:1184517-Prorocentrum_minimum.AAC.3
MKSTRGRFVGYLVFQQLFICCSSLAWRGVREGYEDITRTASPGYSCSNVMSPQGFPRRLTCVTTTIQPRARTRRVSKAQLQTRIPPFHVDLTLFKDVLPALQSREWLGKLLQARGYKVKPPYRGMTRQQSSYHHVPITSPPPTWLRHAVVLWRLTLPSPCARLVPTDGRGGGREILRDPAAILAVRGEAVPDQRVEEAGGLQ